MQINRDFFGHSDCYPARAKYWVHSLHRIYWVMQALNCCSLGSLSSVKAHDMNGIIRAMETMFLTPGFCHCLMHFVWFRMHLDWKGDCKLRAEFDALMTYLHDASLEAGTQKTP